MVSPSLIGFSYFVNRQLHLDRHQESSDLVMLISKEAKRLPGHHDAFYFAKKSFRIADADLYCAVIGLYPRLSLVRGSGEYARAYSTYSSRFTR